MPFPSRGCTTCRKRKVKCDEARPDCFVCRRTARKCLGYDIEASGFGFRNEKLSIPAKSGHESEGTVPALQDLVVVEFNTTSTTREEPKGDPVIPSRQIPTTVRSCLQDKALAFYSTHYLGTFATDPPSGMRLHIKAMLSAPTPIQEPILNLAIAAESLLLYGTVNNNPESLALARESYARALKETLSSVQCVSRACSDEYLTAVMIFSSYEVRHFICRLTTYANPIKDQNRFKPRSYIKNKGSRRLQTSSRSNVHSQASSRISARYFCRQKH